MSLSIDTNASIMNIEIDENEINLKFFLDKATAKMTRAAKSNMHEILLIG